MKEDGFMTLKDYCMENGMENVLEEWDMQQNTDFSAEEIAAFSHQALWWRCKKGHMWKAEVKDRALRKSGCPYCAGKTAIRGETDLATLYPGVAAEWHPTKNGDIKPENVTAGTDKIYWWKCALGHEWKAGVENRALKGNKCPYCSGKKAWPGYNDLATEFPQLMKEWCYEYNTHVDPSKIRPHSGKRVFWKCPEGHIWDTYVFNRTSKQRPGCPVCAGNMKKGVGYTNVSRMEAERRIMQAERGRKASKGQEGAEIHREERYETIPKYF